MSHIVCFIICSSSTFKLSYTLSDTQLFLDQVYNNTISGFTPNSTSPDPNWGKCLQCAAVDRARMKLIPTVARSNICTQCFNQYCYNPQSPPSNSTIPNRKLLSVSPNSVKSFFQRHRALILGLSIGLGLGVPLVLIPLFAICWYVVLQFVSWWIVLDF